MTKTRSGTTPRPRIAGWRRVLAAGSAVLLCVAAALPAPAIADGAPTVSLPHVAVLLASRRPVRIVAFGSSSTQGVGASSPAESYPVLLQRDLDGDLPAGEQVQVINHGIGGIDADEMAAMLVPQVIAARPDLVIWQTGSNDPLRHVPLDRFARETEEGVRRLQAAGIDVILMEPQLCDLLEQSLGAAGYRETLRRIGSELGVPVVKRFDLMRGWIAQGMLTRREMLAPDGLHMADRGYEFLARAVAAEILADAHEKSVRAASGTAGGGGR